MRLDFHARFDLTTGLAKLTLTFPGNMAFCNDMAFDTAHNLYVTDSTGNLFKYPAASTGSGALTLWSSDPSLAPSSPSGLRVRCAS